MSEGVAVSSGHPALLVTEGLKVAGAHDRPLNLVLRAGDRVGLLGAGAETLDVLRALARLRRPTTGRLLWRDVDVAGRPRWLLGARRDDVVLIWANPYALFPSESSPEKVLEAEAERGGSAGFPAALINAQIGELSALQRVRLALTFAANGPASVVLVDDVFSALSPVLWPSIWDQLDGIADAGKGLLVASRHASALTRADRLLSLLDDGGPGQSLRRP